MHMHALTYTQHTCAGIYIYMLTNFQSSNHLLAALCVDLLVDRSIHPYTRQAVSLSILPSILPKLY